MRNELQATISTLMRTIWRNFDMKLHLMFPKVLKSSENLRTLLTVETRNWFTENEDILFWSLVLEKISYWVSIWAFNLATSANSNLQTSHLKFSFPGCFFATWLSSSTLTLKRFLHSVQAYFLSIWHRTMCIRKFFKLRLSSSVWNGFRHAEHTQPTGSLEVLIIDSIDSLASVSCIYVFLPCRRYIWLRKMR